MKNVPNLISYLQEFSGIFYQLLANYFEPFSFGVFLIQKNANVWGPTVSGNVAPRRTLVDCHGRRCPDVCVWVKSRPN
jgi:hypothetical protein